MIFFRTSILAFVLLYCFSDVHGQARKTYLSSEIGTKFEIYQVSNYEGDDLFYYKPWCVSPNLALSFGVKQNDVSIESGLNYLLYWAMTHSPYSSSARNLFTSIQIPVRLKYNVLKNSDHWALNIGVGYSLSLILDKSNGLLKANDRAHFNSYKYIYDSNGTTIDSSFFGLKRSFDNTSKIFHLLEARAEIEYSFDFGLGLFAGASSLTGFRKIIEVDAVYKNNNNPVDRARYTSNGSYFNLFFGVKYYLK